MISLPLALFLSVAAIAVFSFITIAAWSGTRLKEREAYYKSDTLKKIAESEGRGAAAALELMREEERIPARKQLEGIRIGGLVTTAAGIGLMIFLYTIESQHQVFAVGTIPVLIGLALMLYGYILAPKP